MEVGQCAALRGYGLVSTGNERLSISSSKPYGSLERNDGSSLRLVSTLHCWAKSPGPKEQNLGKWQAMMSQRTVPFETIRNAAQNVLGNESHGHVSSADPVISTVDSMHEKRWRGRTFSTMLVAHSTVISPLPRWPNPQELWEGRSVAVGSTIIQSNIWHFQKVATWCNTSYTCSSKWGCGNRKYSYNFLLNNHHLGSHINRKCRKIDNSAKCDTTDIKERREG